MGHRLIRKILDYRTKLKREKTKKILLCGTTNSQILLHQIQKMEQSNMTVLGYVDNNPSLIGEKIHGYPILGSMEELVKIVKRYSVDHIYFYKENLTSNELAAINEIAQDHNISITPVRINLKNILSESDTNISTMISAACF